MERFSSPNWVQCGHKFCLDCIKKIEKNTVIKCPKCAQNTYIGDIRKAYDIAGFIEKLTVNPSDSENQDKLVCELCENQIRNPSFPEIICLCQLWTN
jgi:hypothetical protein